MNLANRSYHSLDFGACQIRVLRVNEAPPLKQVYAFWKEHVATAAWFSPVRNVSQAA